MQVKPPITKYTNPRNYGESKGASPLLKKLSPPLEKYVGHSTKLLDIVKKGKFKKRHID